MILAIYVIALLIASYFFWRLLVWLLNVLTVACARVGGRLHDYFRMQDGEETNAWLLSLLLGITRYPSLVLGTLGFFLVVLHYFYEPFWVIFLTSSVVNAFFFLLIVRLLGIVMGSVMYGNSVKTVIESLES